jgi:hypothetical protein
VSEVDQEIK